MTHFKMKMVKVDGEAGAVEVRVLLGGVQEG
jgi:hypothetical protein